MRTGGVRVRRGKTGGEEGVISGGEGVLILNLRGFCIYSDNPN